MMVVQGGPSSTAEQGTHQNGGAGGRPPDAIRVNCGKPKLMSAKDMGRAIRSLAWPGSGGQDGSETSGVSPNDNHRRERPASLTLDRHSQERGSPET